MQDGLKQAVFVPLALAEKISVLWPSLREIVLYGNIGCKSDAQVQQKHLIFRCFTFCFQICLQDYNKNSNFLSLLDPISIKLFIIEHTHEIVIINVCIVKMLSQHISHFVVITLSVLNPPDISGSQIMQDQLVALEMPSNLTSFIR